MACRIHTVCDPLGWLCLGSIVFVWSYNTWLLPKLIMMPHVAQGTLPAVVAAGYYVVAALCMAALVRASTADPGRVRQDQHMSSEEFRVQSHVCQKCSVVKPARAHHCSRCGHCVRRMDHHCPWINNCVGEGNQWLFIQLCFYTQLLSTYALVVNFAHFYLLPPLADAQPDEFVFHYSVAMLRGAAVMGVMMFLGMAGLFYGQVINILTDLTTIEKMMDPFLEVTAQVQRPWHESLAGVFGTRWKLLWFIPCRRGGVQGISARRYSYQAAVSAEATLDTVTAIDRTELLRRVRVGISRS
ncbi:unnamed protein product [Lampetra fluviatilis]